MAFSRCFISMTAMCVGLCAQTTGNLEGRLLTADTSAPLAGATVLAIQALVAPSQAQPVLVRAVTEADGSFGFRDIPLGAYRLCVHEAGLYLDPCQWGQDVTATAGAAVAPLTLRVQRGVRLSVKVEDGGGFVQAYKARVSAAGELPGAFVAAFLVDTLGRRTYLPLTFASDKLYEYSTLAPPEVDFTLTLASQAFQLSSASGDMGGQSLSFRLRLSLPPPPDNRIRLPFGPSWPPDTVVAVGIAAPVEVVP